MNRVNIKNQDIPVILECDVLVVGAGMSEFAAAVSAARAGVNTILAEKHHFSGGVGTSGLMCSFSNYFMKRDGKQITAGLPIEFIDSIVMEGGGQPNYIKKARDKFPMSWKL